MSIRILRVSRQTKEGARRTVIGLCEYLLRFSSRPHRLEYNDAVVFAPHPDDESLGCGGLIARKRRNGQRVHIIFVTDGSASHLGHSRLTPGDISAIRHQESRQALSILGVESAAIHFLDEPDGTLALVRGERRAELVARIARLLTSIKPTEVFLPCCPDASTEHDATAGFVAEALRQIDARPDVWQYPVWSWWSPVLLLERTLFTSARCRVPTEDFAPVKRRALDHYRSQIEPLPPQPDPVLPPALARIFDADAEYFFRLHLPVSEAARAADAGHFAL